MVFGWLTNETKSMYVARPAEYANDLIFLHPDKSIPRGTKLTVRSNECALFFREGKYIGRINAGTVLLDTANIPFLGHLLIDQFTDANHFICEIFFVTLSEKIFDIPIQSDTPPLPYTPPIPSNMSVGTPIGQYTPLGQYKDKTSAKIVSLGQYKDINSANVVSIDGSMSYSVKVSDPAKLVIELGGQSLRSGQVIEEIFNGRMLNHFRKAVGLRTQLAPVLDVVSNVDAEAISEEVKRLGHDEFSLLGIGIGRVFNVVLGLDAASLNLLREFGTKESELALQAKGMKLATGEGFAEFNLIQGQRAALEGLGKGFGSGNGPVVMTGMNLGANLTGANTRPPSRNVGSGRPSTVLSGQPMFILKTNNGESGPYSVRQIALLAISKGTSLSDLLIRSTEDPEDAAFAADLEPQIVAEYKRRVPASLAKSPNDNTQAFELAFTAAARDGLLSTAEIEMLSNLAVTLGLDGDVSQGRTRVLSIARGRNIQTEG